MFFFYLIFSTVSFSSLEANFVTDWQCQTNWCSMNTLNKEVKYFALGPEMSCSVTPGNSYFASNKKDALVKMKDGTKRAVGNYTEINGSELRWGGDCRKEKQFSLITKGKVKPVPQKLVMAKEKLTSKMSAELNKNLKKILHKINKEYSGKFKIDDLRHKIINKKISKYDNPLHLLFVETRHGEEIIFSHSGSEMCYFKKLALQKGSYFPFIYDGHPYLYGVGTCFLGGCGNVPKLIIDLKTCAEVVSDCHFCT